MATIEHARRVYEQGVRQGLTDWHRLADYPASASICNGIGAEWMPRCLRWMVTRLHPTLEPTAWIHDMEYHYGGTPGMRYDADLRFLANGFKAACGWRWYSFRRYAVMLAAFRFFVLLRLFGAAAWKYNQGGREVK